MLCARASLAPALLLLLAGSSLAQTIEVEVVDPAGAPVSTARIELKDVRTLATRDSMTRLHEVEARRPPALPADGGKSTASLSARGPGAHAVLAWTEHGVAWQEVDVKEGESSSVRLVVEPAGQVTVTNKFPKDSEGIPFDSYGVEAALYRDGFSWGSVSFEVSKGGDRASGTMSAVQPGTYTAICWGVTGGFCWVKDGVRVQAGRTVELKVPDGGGALGGYLCRVVDRAKREDVKNATRRLLLPDQPVVIRCAESMRSVDDAEFSGWIKLSTGRYRLHVEVPGREPFERTVSISRARERTVESMFGKRREAVYPTDTVVLPD